jgi:hypothetical protein
VIEIQPQYTSTVFRSIMTAEVVWTGATMRNLKKDERPHGKMMVLLFKQQIPQSWRAQEKLRNKARTKL